MKTDDKQAGVETNENKAANEPETAENYDAAAYKPEIEKIDKAIRDSVYASMGIGIVPLPLFNVAAVTASNVNLVRKISKLYGIEFKERAAKKIIIAVTGAAAGTLASPLVETALIGIPLIGLPLAIGTKPILNAATTYALGQMFVTHFERGGSFVGANVEALKKDFIEAYKNSRQWIGDKISGRKEAEAVNA